MDLLRNLFANVTSGIVRLAVTAGVLFLCYLFIVKPILKSGEEAIPTSGLERIGKTLDDVNREVRRQVRRSVRTTKRAGRNPQRLIRCVKHANRNVVRTKRCVDRY